MTKHCNDPAMWLADWILVLMSIFTVASFPYASIFWMKKQNRSNWHKPKTMNKKCWNVPDLLQNHHSLVSGYQLLIKPATHFLFKSPTELINNNRRPHIYQIDACSVCRAALQSLDVRKRNKLKYRRRNNDDRERDAMSEKWVLSPFCSSWVSIICTDNENIHTSRQCAWRSGPFLILVIALQSHELLHSSVRKSQLFLAWQQNLDDNYFPSH